MTIDISTGTGTKKIAAGTIGGGGGLITISGGDVVGVFSVDEDMTFTVRHLTITHGRRGDGLGGGIYNSGHAVLSNAIVANSPSGDNCSGTITDGGHNLDDGMSDGFSAATKAGLSTGASS